MSLSERYGLFPIHDHLSFDKYKELDKTSWSADEIDYNADKNDYRGLTGTLKKLIDTVLAFLFVTDGIVIDNIILGFIKDADSTEEQYYYVAQTLNEIVHSETYSLFLDSLCLAEERDDLMKLADNSSVITEKCNWFEELMNSDITKQERFIVSACVEGVFFMASFYIIFWFRNKNLFSSLIHANAMIRRDETVHRNFAILKFVEIFENKGTRPSQEWVHKVVNQAVNLELNFAKHVLIEPVDGLLYEDIEGYIKFLADVILEGCGYEKLWNISSDVIPSWMHQISDKVKGNFYETRIDSYRTSNTKENMDDIMDDLDDIDF